MRKPPAEVPLPLVGVGAPAAGAVVDVVVLMVEREARLLIVEGGGWRGLRRAVMAWTLMEG